MIFRLVVPFVNWPDWQMGRNKCTVKCRVNAHGRSQDFDARTGGGCCLMHKFPAEVGGGACSAVGCVLSTLQNRTSQNSILNVVWCGFGASTTS